MVGWLSLVFSLMGFAGLALAMPRHHELLLRRKIGPDQQWRWRLLGLTLLGTSLWLACMGWRNAVIAVTAWLGMATVTAFVIGMALALRAR